MPEKFYAKAKSAIGSPHEGKSTTKRSRAAPLAKESKACPKKPLVSAILFGILAFLISWMPGVLVSSSTHAEFEQGQSPIANAIPIPHPIIFFLLTIVAYGPALAAIIITTFLSGKEGVRALLGQFLKWKVAWYWYPMALLGPGLVGLVISAIYFPLSGEEPLGWLAMPSTFKLLGFIYAPWGEELGWRGFAQPLLQKRYSGLVTSLIVAILWFGWHHWPVLTPLGQDVSATDYMLRFAFFVAEAIILAWLYNSTKSSLPIAAAGHSGLNLLTTATAARFLPHSILALGFIFLAILLVFLTGRDLSISTTTDR